MLICEQALMNIDFSARVLKPPSKIFKLYRVGGGNRSTRKKTYLPQITDDFTKCCIEDH